MITISTSPNTELSKNALVYGVKSSLGAISSAKEEFESKIKNYMQEATFLDVAYTASLANLVFSYAIDSGYASRPCPGAVAGFFGTGVLSTFGVIGGAFSMQDEYSKITEEEKTKVSKTAVNMFINMGSSLVGIPFLKLLTVAVEVLPKSFYQQTPSQEG